MTQTETIGVVGLGTMGLGIAQVFAQAGFNVLATDEAPSARLAAKDRLAAALDDRVKANKLTMQSRDAILDRLLISPSVESFAPAHMVVEAIIETVEAKQALCAQLEAIVAQTAILATNTSSLSVAEVARGLTHPSRVLGLHFFNPAAAMKLVELVAQAGTDQASLALARTFAERAGKTVIACADRPGFIVNRCARPYYGEALAMLEEGRSVSDIDAAMQASGYRLGPFSLIDLIGADINLAATRSLSNAMKNNPRYRVFDALVRQVESGNLGRKSGAGFIFPHAVGVAPADAAEITLRIEATLANEAAHLLSEGGATCADIDTAIRLGLNFPRGPFAAARAHGVPLIRETLTNLEKNAPTHLKGRYHISPALEKMS